MKKCQPRSLTPYLDDELAADARAQVEEHLRSCASCGALLDEVTSARERVRGMGRAIIPDTVLMPALEVFRDRGGIGPSRLAEPQAMAEVTETEDDAFDDERYHAVLTAPAVDMPTPVDGVGLLEGTEPRDQIDSVEPPEEEAQSGPTWVNMQHPAVPDPPAELPEPGEVYDTSTWSGAAAVHEAQFIPEPPDIPEVAALPEPAPVGEAPLEPGPQVADDYGYGDDAAAGTVLDARPEPPTPQPVPPWVEAEAADVEDIEAHGRRLVEEDLQRFHEAPVAAASPGFEPEPMPELEPDSVFEPEPEPMPDLEPEAEPEAEPVAAAEAAEQPVEEPEPWHPAQPDAWETPAVLAPALPGDASDDEVAAAVADMRRELGYVPEPGLATAAVLDTPAEPETSIDGYRGALRTQGMSERPSGLSSLDTQVKIGLGVAAAMILLLAAVFGLPKLLTHRTQPVAATTSASHPSAAPSAVASPGATAPSAVPSTAPVVPALTGTVTAGSGGTGYHVLRVRSGNPTAGLYRIVFDLQGTGPAPDVQLGQAAVGTLYLESSGTTIDPAVASAFQAIGPVTSITPTGGDAESLKLATSRPVHFTMYYLAGPARLVIDLK